MLQNKMNTFLHQPQPQVRELTLDDNFLMTARNYFWPTTNSKEDAMLLAPVPEGKPKTQEFWLRGYTKHGNTLNTVTPPNFKKNLACDRLAPSINQAPRVRPGIQCAVGHSIVRVNHSIMSHSIWWTIRWWVIQFESEPFSLVSHSIASHSVWWTIR